MRTQSISAAALSRIRIPGVSHRTPLQVAYDVLQWTFDRIVESRMRTVEREIGGRYRHLLPHELEQAGDRLSRRSEDTLPFGGA